MEGTGRGLARDETALHLSLKWLARDRDDVQVALFAGPSQIDLDQDLVSAVRFSQTYPFDTATYHGRREAGGSPAAPSATTPASDVAWYWNRHDGNRWHRPVEPRLDRSRRARRTAPLTVDGGGLQVVVDLRFRF